MNCALRIGLGYDLHRLVDGGPLKLGGIEIPHTKQLEGHSDADVLLHAVTDAMLGALGLGDIGELFPDTDPSHRNRDSAQMLGEAVARVRQAGYRLVNLDCVVLAQQPKMLPFRSPMRQRLAELLEIRDDQVWIKAKTGESVGLIGREEAIAVHCVALLEPIG